MVPVGTRFNGRYVIVPIGTILPLIVLQGGQRSSLQTASLIASIAEFTAPATALATSSIALLAFRTHSSVFAVPGLVTGAK
jgi:hypothetical protein